MSEARSKPLRPEDAGRYAELSQRPNPDDLAIVFSPSLAALLTRAERDKGEALSPEEVLRIRDNAAALAVTAEQALLLEEARGYPDVDPRQPYESWVRMNAEEGL